MHACTGMQFPISSLVAVIIRSLHIRDTHRLTQAQYLNEGVRLNYLDGIIIKLENHRCTSGHASHATVGQKETF